MFTVAAVLLGVGVVPVADGELVLAGLALAALAGLVAVLVTRGSLVRDGALAVPVAQLGAVGLLHAGTGSAAVLFLVLGPVLTLVMVWARAASMRVARSSSSARVCTCASSAVR